MRRIGEEGMRRIGEEEMRRRGEEGMRGKWEWKDLKKESASEGAFG